MAANSTNGKPLDLELAWATNGRGRVGTLTARINGDVVEVDDFSITRKKDRERFIADLCRERPGIDQELLRHEMQSYAASQASKKAKQKPGANESANRSALALLADENRTDVANGRRFVARYGDDLRWCDPWRKWLVWDGQRWAVDSNRRIDALAKAAADDVWRAAHVAMEGIDDQTARALVGFARATSAAKGIASMIGLARSEPNIPITSERLDTDPWLFNVANGVLDLRTGELREPRRDDYVTKLAPVAFDPAADCPTWREFLECIVPDAAVREYLRRLVGYCLTGSTREHVLPFLYGAGANGKSTFVGTVLAMMGMDYAMKAPADLLLEKRGGHPTERADLHGKRFVACIEVDDGRRLAESLVKELTGGDRVRARRMREDFWEFPATHKIWIAANHKPTVRGTDYGIWRRIKMIPFTVAIPDEQQDKTLPERLLAELPGILLWALSGCREWLAGGLGEPEGVTVATTAYRSESDELGRFLSECCILGERCEAGATAIFDTYRAWGGEMNQAKFGRELGSRDGLRSDRYTCGANKGKNYWRGVGLIAAKSGAGEASEATFA